jgi:hypothetical protein
VRDSKRLLVELLQTLLIELQIKQAQHPALRMTGCYRPLFFSILSILCTTFALALDELRPAIDN